MGSFCSKKKASKTINKSQIFLNVNDIINNFKTKGKQIQQQNNIEGNSKIETLKIILTKKLPKPKKWDEDKIWSFGYHKVLLGYLNAYFDHCPIKVNPNVIWQLILNQFSKIIIEKINNK